MASSKLVLTPAYARTMVDDFVKLRARITKLREQEEQLKQVLVDQMTRKNRNSLIGDKFVVTQTEEERTSLSRERVESFLTAAQIKKCTVKTPYTKMTSRNLE